MIALDVNWFTTDMGHAERNCYYKLISGPEDE